MSTPVSVDLLEEYPRALFDAVTTAYPAWLTARAEHILIASGRGLTAEECSSLGSAVSESADLMAHGLCALLATDVDDQRQNPLHLLRASSQAVTEFLGSLGLQPPMRDEFETRAMPDDVYAIGPLAWIDMGDDVHEAGISWGAWKAATVLTRRRAEGKVG